MTKEAYFPQLRHERQTAGLTLLQAGRHIGKTQSHMSKIERGAVALLARDAVTLARVYGVTVDSLLSPVDI